VKKKNEYKKANYFRNLKGEDNLYQMVDGYNLAEVTFFKYITNGSPLRDGK